MDDDETIPRREAVAGLSLLGALAIALVGTIAFRIVHAAPRRGSPPLAAPWASQPAAVLKPAPETPTTDQLFADDVDPPASPIPVTSDGLSSIPVLSTNETLTPDPATPPPVIERPRFIAPGAR